MEPTIDFRFRLLEREEFIALSPGRSNTAMLAPPAATVNHFCRRSSYSRSAKLRELAGKAASWIFFGFDRRKPLRLRLAAGESE